MPITKTVDRVSGIVPVLFRMDRSGEFREVTAVFPTIPASPGLMSCYAHIGQHGSCSRDWLRSATRPATAEEYAKLKQELEAAPYFYQLRIVKRITAGMDRERWAAERR